MYTLVTLDTVISLLRIIVTLMLHYTEHCYLIYRITITWILLIHVRISLLHGLTCIHALVIHTFLLHGSLFLIHKLLLLEYLYTLVALYTSSCYRSNIKILNLLHVINIVNKLAYLHSGIHVIRTVIPASGKICAR